jgi:nucleotide-binding universal stress UspA family protein
VLQLRRLLVPIDDSPLSDKVLDHAFSLAARFGARVDVLYVRHETRPTTLDDQARDEEEVDRERDAVRVTALLRLRDGGHPLPADHVDAEVRTGPPLDCILAAADEGRHDLIVMGTHGPQGLADRFVGTTTERVLLRARQPLFVVREDAE